MVPKPDQARIKALLTEAITVLCKNGLGYEYNCGIQGLLGITLDDEDVFLVDLKESIVKKERPQPEPVEERSPTPVEPLSPSRVSSPAGQFIGRKRRRSGSTATDASSPAKRPSYSEDQGDDVIVIKEEGIDQDGGDMYDSGGGNGHQMPHDESYGVTLQDDPGDYGGAGCSQWETSSSSSQSAWPQVAQFDTTQLHQQQQQQQQQQIASSSSSSSLMTPTQVPQGGMFEWEGSNPRPTLNSQSVRVALIEGVVRPALEQGFSISAMRLVWFGDDATQLQPFWENIGAMRDQLDSMLRDIPGVIFFVSCISATMSGKRKKSISFPAVSYWLARQSDVPGSVVFDKMHRNGLGAKMKLILQPYQESEDAISQSLCVVAKDSVDGIVRRVLDRLTAISRLSQTIPVMKLFSKRQADKNWMREAAENLRYNNVTAIANF